MNGCLLREMSVVVVVVVADSEYSPTKAEKQENLNKEEFN